MILPLNATLIAEGDSDLTRGGNTLFWLIDFFLKPDVVLLLANVVLERNAW
jgi:hypothetical protein